MTQSYASAHTLIRRTYAYVTIKQLHNYALVASHYKILGHRVSSVFLISISEWAYVTGPIQWRTQDFFFRGGSINSVEDRGQNGDLGCGSPLVRGSGGICNLVQEIPFHTVKLP